MTEFGKLITAFGILTGLSILAAIASYNMDPRTSEAHKQADRQQALEQIQEYNQRVQDRLPPGCKINFYGWYRYHQNYSDMPIVAVFCKKQDTTNLLWRQPTGKFTRPELQVAITER